MSGTFRFSYDADYNQNKSVVKETLPSINYDFQTEEGSGLDDVLVGDIQFHFNSFLRGLGYVIEVEDD